MNNLVNIINQNGNLVVSSREVADNFNKQNKHVIEAIREIETSVENSTHLFIPNNYKDSYGRVQPEYLLTRDGFSLLVMGFTGQKALEWKLKYIEAFNKMEQVLKEQNSILKLDSKFLFQIAQQLEDKERQIALDRPKVLFAEAVENSDDVILVKEMALILTQQGFNIGQNQLFQFLRDNEYLCKKLGDMYNLPTKKYEHLFKVTKRTIQNTDKTIIRNTPKITGRGQMYFVKKFTEFKELGLTIRDLLTKEEAV